MYNFLNWLDGKKTYILAVISAVNSLLVASNVYTAEVGATIQAIASMLLGGAKLYGNKLGIGK